MEGQFEDLMGTHVEVAWENIESLEDMEMDEKANNKDAATKEEPEGPPRIFPTPPKVVIIDPNKAPKEPPKPMVALGN